MTDLINAGRWSMPGAELVDDVFGLDSFDAKLYGIDQMQNATDWYREHGGPDYVGSLDFSKCAVIGTVQVEMDLVVDLTSASTGYPVLFWENLQPDWSPKFETFEHFVDALRLRE